MAVGDQHLFVMLSLPEQDGAARNEELRARYQRSGLYRIDGAAEPVWVVDWHASTVELTSDGKHLIRWGPWPLLRNYRELALEFYEDGQLLKSYQVADLVARPAKLPRSVSHYAWQAEAKLDHEKRELFLRTHNGEEYLFNVTTGEIIASTRDTLPRNEHLVMTMVGGAVLLLGALIGLRRWMRLQRAT